MADRAPDPRMLAVLKKAVGVLQEEGIPFALAGSMACWALGGPPSRHDVDLALLQSDAERALEALAAAGFRIERPPEGWLVKVWDDGILVDLIWAPMGLRVTHEVLRAARPVNVDGMPVPALAPTDVLTSKLLALNEGHLDFEGLLAMVRGVREQVDWDELRRRTEAQPLARSFLYLAGELGLTPEPEPEPARLAKGA
ncbi:MAG TPA: nucleotidyltransferase [Acidimicrobiia bacterium]|nr:nucleotidyltransferase [Acidimicrobiia bacterium]HTC80070.1 nucleotidyltransferase [Acidimicrobiia bacterium]